MHCWICDKIMYKYILLPEEDDIFQTRIKIDTYIIKTIDTFTFLYYTICYYCTNIYLDNYPFYFKNIINRELGM